MISFKQITSCLSRQDEMKQKLTCIFKTNLFFINRKKESYLIDIWLSVNKFRFSLYYIIGTNRGKNKPHNDVHVFSSIVLHWFYLSSCSWVSCYLTASCLVHVVAHRASTGRPHPSLSAAATLASAQDPHPLSSLTFLLDCSSPCCYGSSSLSSAPRCPRKGAMLESLFRSFLRIWISILCILFLGSVVSCSMRKEWLKAII